MNFIKKFFKAIGILICAVLVVVVGLLIYLSATEFRPSAEQPADLWNRGEAVESLSEPELDYDVLTVLTWNTGYCGLGKESDFFMDGGSEVRPDSEELVRKNYSGMLQTIRETAADFILLQEVDTESTRSYGFDQAAQLRTDLAEYAPAAAYALNFSTQFVPYPWPPIGRVNSGLMTLTSCGITEATRISLPCPFSWPVSMVNLKRCLLVTRIPISGTKQELVLVNLHLEAYDDGEGKLAQSKQLRSFVEGEYQKGNYVIAGGDWNQIFPNSEASWPNTHQELWTPGYLDPAELSEGWSYVWDDSVPTCRLLNQPYDPSDSVNTQYYVIDGFLVSPNLRVLSVQTLDEGFACTDHNPVLLTVSMGAAS